MHHEDITIMIMVHNTRFVGIVTNYTSILAPLPQRRILVSLELLREYIN